MQRHPCQHAWGQPEPVEEVDFAWSRERADGASVELPRAALGAGAAGLSELKIYDHNSQSSTPHDWFSYGGGHSRDALNIVPRTVAQHRQQEDSGQSHARGKKPVVARAR